MRLFTLSPYKVVNESSRASRCGVQAMIETIRDVAERLAPRTTFALLEEFQATTVCMHHREFYVTFVRVAQLLLTQEPTPGCTHIGSLSAFGLSMPSSRFRLWPYLRRASLKGACVVKCALSDKEGFADLYPLELE